MNEKQNDQRMGSDDRSIAAMGSYATTGQIIPGLW